MEHLDSYLAFIKETELLKTVLRDAYTSTGRQESTAEHSWRLAMLAGLMAGEFPDLDRDKVLMLCLIHDLGELYEGDISAVLEPDQSQKYEVEHRAVTRLFSMLPTELEKKYLDLWEEYETVSSKEARLVKALDKAETIIQHNQGKNPSDFDLKFNLKYGKEHFQGPLLEKLRERLDSDIRARMDETAAGHTGI